MYEIPDDLKQLYRHWEYHTQKHVDYDLVELNEAVLNEITTFVQLRMIAWNNWRGGIKPYSQDVIVSQYRFCNIYRELDRQTIEIHQLCAPLRDDFALWLLNIAFCRFVCNPQTVRDVGLLSFDSDSNYTVYEKLLAHSRPKYGVAYVFPVSAITRTEYNTRELFFCLYLPKVIGEIAKIISSHTRVSVSELLDKILPIFGFGMKFHWTEILIDVAYQYEFIDLYARFPIGPGSLPTMKMLNSDADPKDVAQSLISAKLDVSHLTYEGRPVFLSVENWEGIGCEFRKYTNLKAGFGRRRLYR
jgi:hypothetical protein